MKALSALLELRAMLGGGGRTEAAEANLRTVAHAAGQDPDAAVARARQACRTTLLSPADAMDQERRRLLEGPQVEADVLRQRMDLRALLRPRGWHGEVVSVEVPPLVSPFVPLRPMGLAALGCRLASNPRQPTDFGRVEDCPPAARHSNHGSD